MRKFIVVFAILSTIVFFVGIIDYGEEFINIELGIKYPTSKFFFTVNDENVITLNEKIGVLSTIIPYFLIQAFLLSVFVKIKNKVTLKQFFFGLMMFLTLLILLIIFLNLAFFYNINLLYIIITLAILIVNYLLIGFFNRLLNTRK